MYIGLDLIQKPVCQMCSMFTMWHALMTKNNIVFQMHTPAHTSHNFNANTGTSTSAITQSSNMNLNPLLSNIPMYPLFCFSVPLCGCVGGSGSLQSQNNQSRPILSW